MADSYTRVAKPTGTPYTAATFQGTQMWDDPLVAYSDSSVFYDSANTLAWTNVAKPSGELITTPGMATGLIIPTTYSTVQRSAGVWVKVNKPT